MTKVNKYTKKSASRLAAVQSMYEINMVEASSKAAVDDYLEFFEGDKISEHEDISLNAEFYKKLVKETHDRCADINEMIDESLPENITPKRLDVLARSVLQVAIAELLSEMETDAAVIINEYVDVTHAFYSGKEHKLVNGILNTLSKKIRY
tara:strand:- start:15207 stop:15659 length:453 start_codon:yes stop_codon:yes gene_type:complete